MLRVNPVPQQLAGVAFPISGEYDVSAAPLQYSDGGSYTTIPPVNQKVSWKFQHPGLSAGNWMIVIRYPNTSLSASVAVVVVATGGGAVSSVGVARATSSAIAEAESIILPPPLITALFSTDFTHPPFV